MYLLEKWKYSDTSGNSTVSLDVLKFGTLQKNVKKETV